MLEVVARAVGRPEKRGKPRARCVLLQVVVLAALTIARLERTLVKDGGAAQLHPLQAVQHLLAGQHEPGKE